MHNGASFMQLLEGPADEIALLFKRIRADTRHSGVVHILGETVTHRACPTWSMNYYRVDQMGGCGAMIARGEDPIDNLMSKDAPRELIYLFSNFIKQSPVN